MQPELIKALTLESIISVAQQWTEPRDTYQTLDCLSLFFQDDKDDDMCEEEEQCGNKANNSASRKRQLWWGSHRSTDEKNVRQGYGTSEQCCIDDVSS